MYAIQIKTDFSAAHCLREVGGGCESLHGHNFTVEVGIESEALNDLGIVIDFRDLKTKTRDVLQALDHRYLNELPFFQGKNPSSENLAAYIFEEINRRMDPQGCRISWVSVWESDSSRATYRRTEK